MKNIKLWILLIIFAFQCLTSTYAQKSIPNELPPTGYRTIVHGVFKEINNCYYFPSGFKSSVMDPANITKPAEIHFNKYNFTTQKLISTVKIAGDTSVNDSVLAELAFCEYNNGLLYLVANRFYRKDAANKTNPHCSYPSATSCK